MSTFLLNLKNVKTNFSNKRKNFEIGKDFFSRTIDLNVVVLVT